MTGSTRHPSRAVVSWSVCFVLCVFETLLSRETNDLFNDSCFFLYAATLYLGCCNKADNQMSSSILS